jgi:hypothetical protein
MARHIIMDSSGHTTIEFDKEDSTALADAEHRFKRLVAKGFIPAESKGGGQHHISQNAHRDFDPRVEETIFIPALKGG